MQCARPKQMYYRLALLKSSVIPLGRRYFINRHSLGRLRSNDHESIRCSCLGSEFNPAFGGSSRARSQNSNSAKMRHLKTLYLSLAQALFGIFLVWSVAAIRASQDNPTATILRIEQTRVAALEQNDFPALSDLLADDLIYTHSNAQVDNKKSYLASLHSGALKYISLAHEQQQVRLYGDTALLSGLTTVKSLSQGKPGEVKIRFLIVYLRRDQRWQMVAWQSTRLP